MDMCVPHQLSLLMFLLNSWSRYTKPYTVLNQTLNYKEEKNQKTEMHPHSPQKTNQKAGWGKSMLDYFTILWFYAHWCSLSAIKHKHIYSS